MALPVLDAVFASSADLPRTQLLSKWLTEQLGSGSIADFSTLPERYLYAKIAVSLGGPRTEQEYIELPKSYAWSDIYGAIIFNRTAPAAPSSLTLTPLTSSSIKLDWVTNGASVAYSVERSVDGAAFQVIGTTAIGATTATNTGLSIASNYQYRIRGSSGGFFTGYSNTASASTYDANASSFIATSGATDIVAINDFVLGVKTLGLWNSMVCWPLRSSQNAGTGTTAYSLGGLGTFNGTLTNGPTWEADGITFVAASSTHITTPLTVGPTPKFTLWGVGSSSALTGAVVAAWGTTSPTSFAIVRKHSANRYAYLTRSSAATNNYPGSNGSVSGFASIGLGTQGANTLGTVNGVLDATIASLPDESGTQAVSIGIQTPATNAVPYNGTISFALAYVAGDGLTTAQQLSLHNVYKSTLGTGLGLP
jgi:hypothetical protein